MRLPTHRTINNAPALLVKPLVIARARSARGNPSPRPSRPRQSRDWGIPSSAPLVPINASGRALSVTSDRKYPKNAAKTNGFGFLARAWCGEHRDLLPPRIKRCKPVPCFRTVPAPIHRDALRACAARPSGENPWVYRLVRCGHRALRNSIAIRCVGAGFYPARPCQVIHIFVGVDAPVRPLCRAPCKNPCHCEGA